MGTLASANHTEDWSTHQGRGSRCAYCMILFYSLNLKRLISASFLQSQQLYHILVPDTHHHPAIYTALLSSLAKAIILQAETEVTTKKDSAEPLAQVACNLLGTLDGFPEVFFAKLMQRVGGWPIPCNIPSADFDGRPWADEAEKAKVRGLRRVTKEDGREGLESDAEYAARVAGVMRVYFCILQIPPERPIKTMFQLPRYWTWFARLLSETRLLESVVAAQIIYSMFTPCPIY